MISVWLLVGFCHPIILTVLRHLGCLLQVRLRWIILKTVWIKYKVHLSQNNGALKSQNIFQLLLDYHDKLKGKHGYGIFLQSMNQNILHLKPSCFFHFQRELFFNHNSINKRLFTKKQQANECWKRSRWEHNDFFYHFCPWQFSYFTMYSKD